MRLLKWTVLLSHLLCLRRGEVMLNDFMIVSMHSILETFNCQFWHYFVIMEKCNNYPVLFIPWGQKYWIKQTAVYWCVLFEYNRLLIDLSSSEAKLLGNCLHFGVKGVLYLMYHIINLVDTVVSINIQNILCPQYIGLSDMMTKNVQPSHDHCLNNCCDISPHSHI